METRNTGQAGGFRGFRPPRAPVQVKIAISNGNLPVAPWSSGIFIQHLNETRNQVRKLGLRHVVALTFYLYFMVFGSSILSVHGGDFPTGHPGKQTREEAWKVPHCCCIFRGCKGKQPRKLQSDKDNLTESPE